VEVVIPVALVQEYEVATLEKCIEMFGDSTDTERTFYQTFLMRTDHIPLKLIEGSVSSADVAEELKYREIARQEIARLEGKPNEPKADKITLDARITNIEADVFSMAVDHEERIIMMELGLTE
jgi:hypothetical protein